MMASIRGLRPLLWLTDLGFLTYWLITALGWLPPQWAYSEYRNPLMVAWNWSFAPLDLLASASGLMALELLRRKDARAFPILIVTLTLTFCAGLQAIAFWAIRGDLDLTWWLPNIFLMVYPLWFLARIIRWWPNNSSPSLP